MTTTSRAPVTTRYPAAAAATVAGIARVGSGRDVLPTPVRRVVGYTSPFPGTGTSAHGAVAASPRSDHDDGPLGSHHPGG